MAVPGVLRSGDHGAIARWRLEQQQQRTRERRPDLYARWQEQQAQQ
jgi:tRNA (guanine37-N1)-methyltransferase